jgi:two-component system nitrate/nitrite response regulator NarL
MKIRLLVVDDDDRFVAALLETDGRFLIIGTARNGREAVELAAVHTPDVVVMDIEMPVMNGIEATRRIRATEPATNVIALSGTNDQERALEMRAAGASDYIRKDRFADEIIDTILTGNDLAGSLTERTSHSQRPGGRQASSRPLRL